VRRETGRTPPAFLCMGTGWRVGVGRLRACALRRSPSRRPAASRRGGWPLICHLPRGRCRRDGSVDQILPLATGKGLGAVEMTRASSRWTESLTGQRYSVGDSDDPCSLRRSPSRGCGIRWSARAAAAAPAHDHSGTTTLKLPVTEALRRNAFVRSSCPRRSAVPASRRIGRPTIRVGIPRAPVHARSGRPHGRGEAAAAEYARATIRAVALQVRDDAGQGHAERGDASGRSTRGARAHGIPDARSIDLLYRPRGLGLRAREHAHPPCAAGWRKARRGGARRWRW